MKRVIVKTKFFCVNILHLHYQTWLIEADKRPSFSQAYTRLASVMPALVKVQCSFEEENKLKCSTGDIIAVISGK